MPGRDRTGPNGLGSMTGRRMGFCADNSNLNYSNRGFGYGRGNRGGLGVGGGYGQGYGYRNMNIENTPNVSDKTIIENEIRILKDQLSSLEEQLKKTGAKSDE
ncbi:DUF5320 domain-containing protein [Candidatus Neomarinimicrobiota bacterium]